MSIHIREYRQIEWSRAGVGLLANSGDFDTASGMRPDPTRRRMLRAPGWAAHAAWPPDFGDPEGMLFDRTVQYYGFIGLDPADSHVATAWYNTAWTYITTADLGTASATYGALTGLNQRNACYWANLLYFISGAAAVYSADPTSAPMTLLWSGSGGETAQALCPCGDQLFLATTLGNILRLNAARDGFEAYYSPRAPLDIRYITAFNQYLLLVARTWGGALALFRLPDYSPVTLHQLAQLEATTGNEPSASPFTDGCLFTTHNHDLFFTSGWYAAATALDLYRFDGSRIERVTQITGLPTLANVRSAGLAVWRGELLFWYIHASSGAHLVKLLVGDAFIDFCPASFAVSSHSCIYSVAGDLISPGKSGSAEGFYRTSGLQDGYVQTARLDCGYPGRVKRLDRITAIVSGHHASFNVVLKYRTDDSDTWTTAVTTANTRRITADPIGVHFYTVQLRIEFDDNSGLNLDYSLDDLSVMVSVDE